MSHPHRIGSPDDVVFRIRGIPRGIAVCWWTDPDMVLWRRIGGRPSFFLEDEFGSWPTMIVEEMGCSCPSLVPVSRWREEPVRNALSVRRLRWAFVRMGVFPRDAMTHPLLSPLLRLPVPPWDPFAVLVPVSRDDPRVAALAARADEALREARGARLQKWNWEVPYERARDLVSEIDGLCRGPLRGRRGSSVSFFATRDLRVRLEMPLSFARTCASMAEAWTLSWSDPDPGGDRTSLLAPEQGLSDWVEGRSDPGEFSMGESEIEVFFLLGELLPYLIEDPVRLRAWVEEQFS